MIIHIHVPVYVLLSAYTNLISPQKRNEYLTARCALKIKMHIQGVLYLELYTDCMHAIIVSKHLYVNEMAYTSDINFWLSMYPFAKPADFKVRKRGEVALKQCYTTLIL